jgi:O-antigen/teichoic acid export membrane protein
MKLLYSLFLGGGIRLAGIILGLLMTIVVTKTYPVSLAGQFFTFYALVCFSSSTIRLGTNRELVRLVSIGEENEIRKAYSSSLFIITLMSIVVSFVYLICTLFISEVGVFSVETSIYGLSIFLLAILTIYSSLYQAIGKYAYSVVVLNIAYQLIFCLAVYYHVIIGLNVSLYYLFVISLFIPVAFLFFINFNLISPSFFSIIREGKTIGFWVYMMSGQWLNYGVIILSGFLLSSSDVAILSVSQRVSMLMLVFTNLFDIIFSRRIAIYYKENRIEKLKVMLRSLRLFAVLGVISSFLFFFTAGQYVFTFIGYNYWHSNVLFLLLAFYSILVINSPSNLLIEMSGNGGLIGKISLISSILLTVLCLIFGFFFEINGILIGMIIAISFQFFMVEYHSFRILELLKI